MVYIKDDFNNTNIILHHDVELWAHVNVYNDASSIDRV